MPVKESTTPQSAGSMVLAVVIALASTAALVVFAATQSPATSASVARRSRAAVNAAEEWAIWAPPKTTASQAGAAVTIAGCLEKHGSRFRLTDTSGADAPTSRSWKSAFFKKAAASVDLVDAANRTKLAGHVGQRVSVTGTLDDREMQVMSLQRAAGSCS